MNNTLQKHITLTQVRSSLLDLPLVLESPSMLHQWPVTSYTLKPLISFPPQTDVRHYSLQDIPSHRTLTAITMFRAAFRNSCHEPNTFNPNFPSHFQMDFYLQIIMGQQSVQWIGYMLEDLLFKSWQEQENYLFSRTSRSATAPTQPPNSPFSLAVNWRELTD